MKMKKTLTHIAFAALPALLFLSCAREAETPVDDALSIGRIAAEVSEMPMTKAHLEDGCHIIWDLTDQIGVFSDLEDALPFTKTGEDNTFASEEEVHGHQFYAFYPYSEAAFDPANRTTVRLNSAVTAAGANPVLSVPMVAIGEGANFSFTQTCGVVHFTLEGTHKLSSVTLKGNAGEPLAGSGAVSLEEDLPVLVLDADAQTSLTHTFATPVDLSQGPCEVYFVLPPMTFPQGITIDMVCENGTATKSATHEITVKRAIIKNFKAFDMDELIVETPEDFLTIERNALIALYNAAGGRNWTSKRSWNSTSAVGNWYGVTTDEEGRVIKLDLHENNLKGTLPDELYNLTKLQQLSLYGNTLSGTISPLIGQLQNLLILWLDTNSLSGSLPEELADCANLVLVDLYSNQFSGDIPESFRYWVPWVYSYGSILYGNDLNWLTCRPIIPPFEVTLTNGATCKYDFCLDNEYTILFEGSTSSEAVYTEYMMPYINKIYEYGKDKGIDVLAWFFQKETTDPTAAQFAASHDAHYKVFQPSDDNTISYSYWDNCYPFSLFTYNDIPTVSVFDSTGQLVWSNMETVSPFDIVDVMEYLLDEQIPTPGAYNSTDYSADGTVHVLQTATEGAGIDIVLMGDAYSDRQIASGKYMEDISTCVDYLFSEEPFKSFRNLFNVYVVDVVSQNEGYQVEAGSTALDGYFGEGTEVGGYDELVEYYAYLALDQDEERLMKSLMVVIMNEDYYAGTTAMYYPGEEEVNDYGPGFSIAYFPTYYSEPDVFAALMSHEAGGHGFGKLADEYWYSGTGTIPSSEKTEYQQMAAYGWYKNVDFTSNRTSVKWAKFLSDSRYAGEDLGVYQGACGYERGAYRPTQNSLMNDNTGGFNAPSREAIWYKMHKMAYGDDWQFSHEAFVTWDMAHQQAHAPATKAMSRPLPPTTPPAVRKWKGMEDMLQKAEERREGQRKAREAVSGKSPLQMPLNLQPRKTVLDRNKNIVSLQDSKDLKNKIATCQK